MPARTTGLLLLLIVTFSEHIIYRVGQKNKYPLKVFRCFLSNRLEF